MFQSILRTFLAIGFSFFWLTNTGFGQTPQFPNGIYLNYESLINRTPDRTDTLKIVQRTKSEINWVGGHNFRMESVKELPGWRFIHKEVMAYVWNDSIFLNAHKLDLDAGFTLALSNGIYLPFVGHEDPQASRTLGSSGTSGVIGGALGGAIGGLIAGAFSTSQDKNQPLYILSLKTGNTKRLGPLYLSARLEENCPELVNEFERISDNDANEVLLRYITLLNNCLENKRSE
jgi:hypothetical protein